jgi:hypothetical protein
VHHLKDLAQVVLQLPAQQNENSMQTLSEKIRKRIHRMLMSGVGKQFALSWGALHSIKDNQCRKSENVDKVI